MIDMPAICWAILTIAAATVWVPELFAAIVVIAQRRQDETVEL